MTDNAASREARARELLSNRHSKVVGFFVAPEAMPSWAVAGALALADEAAREPEERCPVCGGPAWVKHTGSIMPGIGIPCPCDPWEAKLAKMDPEQAGQVRDALADEAASQPRAWLPVDDAARNGKTQWICRGGDFPFADWLRWVDGRWTFIDGSYLGGTGEEYGALFYHPLPAALHDTAPTDQAQRGEVEREWLRGDWYEAWQDLTENADEDRMAELERLKGRVDRTILAALAQSGDPS